MKQTCRDYLFIITGGIIYAIALKYFVFPSEIVLTGTEGIAVALSYYFSSHWLFIIIYAFSQFFLLIFAYIKVNRKFSIRSAVVVSTVVFLLIILPDFYFARPEPQNERIILVLFGGLLAGAAKALAFKGQASTADEDILGAYFAMKYLKPVGLIAVFAAIISTVFGLTMNYLKENDLSSVINTLMYTCIYIFMFTETLNNLYKKFQITMAVLITKNQDRLANAITKAFEHRTFTIQPGTGGHSKEDYSMIQTVITKEELPALIAVIEKNDPACFYYYYDIEGTSKKYYITPIGSQ